MLKRFFSIFIPASLLVLIFLAIIYFSESRATRKLIETKESDILDLQLETIASDFNSVLSDLFVLADSHEFTESFHQSGDRYVDIAAHFAIFSREKRLYDQIRLLDINGKEQLRVNFNGGKPTSVPAHMLKDKSDRYYFKKSITLGRGEVYVSPLDLNVERGKVEKPYKPMIRFATPVFDSFGKKKGVVVLNYFGGRLLEHFESVASGSSGEIVFLNSEGYWLFSPKKEDEWAFMFGGDRTFQEVYPEEWKQVAKADSGGFSNSSGLFMFRTVYPLSYASAQDMVPDRKVSQLEERSYYWKFVSRIPPDVLNAGTSSLLSLLLLVYVGLLVLIAVGARYIVYASVSRESANEALKVSEDRMLAMQSASFDATIVSNIEGKIVEANSFAERLLGYSEAELVGKELDIIIPDRFKDRHHECFRRFITTGEGKMLGTVVEVSALKKGGVEFEADMIVNSFMLGGEMYFMASLHSRAKG
ncbi:MAG: PAS domain S-box protein [Proteobacteria bacterium]|nr:PAS domain S-box protein [Pseudomonadota bacterium]